MRTTSGKRVHTARTAVVRISSAEEMEAQA
jgi:hypothetical protein